jgi:hypothetical protein
VAVGGAAESRHRHAAIDHRAMATIHNRRTITTMAYNLRTSTLEAALETARRRKAERIVAEIAYEVAADLENYAGLDDEFGVDEDGLGYGPSEREMIAHLAAMARPLIAQQGLDLDRYSDAFETNARLAWDGERAADEIEFAGDGDWDQRALAEHWHRYRQQQRERRSAVDQTPRETKRALAFQAPRRRGAIHRGLSRARRSAPSRTSGSRRSRALARASSRGGDSGDSDDPEPPAPAPGAGREEHIGGASSEQLSGFWLLLTERSSR